MRDATIVTLYKNKGDRGDCNNYRGISLLCIVGKVFARILLSRLQTLAARVYPESQCGFRAGRSTIDMIFTVRQIQEKCREQGKPLYLAFIDLTKAFDLVSRKGLFQLLEKIGCPPKLHSLVVSFHEDMQGTVSFDGSCSEPFSIKSGVKQGCVLAPTLFGIFYSLLMSHAFKESQDGIYLHSRSNGKLFNIARLRAKTRVSEITIRDMLFADDAAFATHTEEALQRLIDRFANACKDFGLTISIKKTKISAQDVSQVPSIQIDNHTLEVVDEFIYLGSTISMHHSLDTEINRRIGGATSTMSKLTKRVWENSLLTQNTKMKVYQACVLSTLLYGSETWTTYMRQEHRLNTFHVRCMRRILHIQWQDHVPNTDVLARAGSPSIYSLLSQRRLRWLGHVRRMEDGRIPKDVLYAQLTSGSRRAGRPTLRFSDACKRDMKASNIDPASWEDSASDRCCWRRKVKQGAKQADTDREQRAAAKRDCRKARATTSPTASNFICSVCIKDCHSRIGLYSHARRCRQNSEGD